MAGWFRVPREAFLSNGKLKGALAVYVCLCSHADGDGRAWPSFAKIARETGASRKTAKRYVAKLVAAGLVCVEGGRLAPAGDPDSHLYTIVGLAPAGAGVGSDLPQVGSDLPQVGSDLPDGGVNLTPGGGVKNDPLTRLSNTENKKTLAGARSAAFVKPTLEEVSAYCSERKNTVNAEEWMAHYESNGWRVGKNPMKDWKAAVRTWELNRRNGLFDQPPAGGSNGRVGSRLGRVEAPAGKYARFRPPPPAATGAGPAPPGVAPREAPLPGSDRPRGSGDDP
jgi:hypothetical protein